MECPPAIGMPACVHTDSPPARIERITETGSLSSGMPTSASAMIGLPPMAYTSEIALVAAMRPKSNGSSTIGVKKSVVATSACSSFSRYTAASSAVSVPTSRSLVNPLIGADARISERTAGAILQPQPPPWLNCVSLIFSGAFISVEFNHEFQQLRRHHRRAHAVGIRRRPRSRSDFRACAVRRRARGGRNPLQAGLALRGEEDRRRAGGEERRASHREPLAGPSEILAAARLLLARRQALRRDGVHPARDRLG